MRVVVALFALGAVLVVIAIALYATDHPLAGWSLAVFASGITSAIIAEWLYHSNWHRHDD